MSLAYQHTEWITPEEYLSAELNSECRHEYLGGHMYAMAGASEEHNIIALNIASALHIALRGKPCRAFINDMKVKIDRIGRDVYYYPDVMVSCGPQGESRYFKIDPTVIFEVLSPETESIDRREKYFSYTSIDTLQSYILMEQTKIGATIFRRAGTEWQTETLNRLDEILRLESLQIELPLSTIYERVF